MPISCRSLFSISILLLLLISWNLIGVRASVSNFRRSEYVYFFSDSTVFAFKISNSGTLTPIANPYDWALPEYIYGCDNDYDNSLLFLTGYNAAFSGKGFLFPFQIMQHGKLEPLNGYDAETPGNVIVRLPSRHLILLGGMPPKKEIQVFSTENRGIPIANSHRDITLDEVPYEGVADESKSLVILDDGHQLISCRFSGYKNKVASFRGPTCKTSSFQLLGVSRSGNYLYVYDQHSHQINRSPLMGTEG